MAWEVSTSETSSTSPAPPSASEAEAGTSTPKASSAAISTQNIPHSSACGRSASRSAARASAPANASSPTAGRRPPPSERASIAAIGAASGWESRAAASVSAATRAGPARGGPGGRRSPPGGPRRGAGGAREFSASLARPHVQVTAAVASRLPGIGRELEAGRLEGAVVHAAGDATERGHVGVGHAGLVPRLLQRTALELDVEAASIAALDARREHPALVGDEGQKGVAQPRQVGGTVARERAPDLPAARLDGAGQETGGLRLPR